MSYWDTSTLVKLYVKEPDSTLFEQHLLDLTSPILITPSPIIINRIGLYEARVTFHRKESEGGLPGSGGETLYTKLTQDVAAGKVILIDIGADVEQEYGRILNLCYQRTPFIPIRTLDAIH